MVQYMESLGVRGKEKIEREKKEGGGEGGEKRAHLFCSVSKCSWLISNDIVCTYIPEHAMLSSTFMTVTRSHMTTYLFIRLLLIPVYLLKVVIDVRRHTCTVFI